MAPAGSTAGAVFVLSVERSGILAPEMSQSEANLASAPSPINNKTSMQFALPC